MKNSSEKPLIAIQVEEIKDGKVVLGNKNYPPNKVFMPLSQYKEFSVRTKPYDYGEPVLKVYLESIFEKGFHEKPEIFGRLSVYDNQYEYVKDVCLKYGFIKNDIITDKGIEFLRHLEQKEISLRQEKINKYLTLATWILALGTVALVLTTVLL